ncbi:MAG: NAD(P)/FAD-dependent oxidoreductase, partial [Pseudomonadota bacterium]
MAASSSLQSIDTLILGAGAAGLFCAGVAGQLGHRVMVLDHAKKPAEKVRISGGGRCNFTNIHTRPDRFLSQNPHFAKSALARYTPFDFMDLLTAHGLTWHEKTLGQLFCDEKSQAIIRVLLKEVEAGQGKVELGVTVLEVVKTAEGFRVETSIGTIRAKHLVVATGGLSIPKMGATGFAYDLARQFDLSIIPPRAGLVPFTFEGQPKEEFAQLAGVSCPIGVHAGGAHFNEAMLFTHRGLSGPAVLQISSYWQEGEAIEVDLFAGEEGAALFKNLRDQYAKKSFGAVFEKIFPSRLAALLGEKGIIPAAAKLGEMSNRQLEDIAHQLSHWQLTPSGTEGWRTAEVTVGGIDTNELSSKTMEAKKVPGLYFIGEAVDVTGWLGGYNFQ